MTQQCILWTGYIEKRRGYGLLYVGPSGNRRQRFAHRVAWEAVYGPIPTGMQLHHLCKTPSCVNLCHLVLLTPAQHNRLHAQSAPLQTCSRGHALTAANRGLNGLSANGVPKYTCLTCKRLRRHR